MPDCVLPAEGSGQAVLHRLPQAGTQWTDTERVHDERGLKDRPPNATRVVPLPPELVVLWRESTSNCATADDRRLFFNERGGIVASPQSPRTRAARSLCSVSRSNDSCWARPAAATDVRAGTRAERAVK